MRYLKESTVKTPVVVLTIGHSTRKLNIFINLLQAHGAKRLVDVRTIPRSRNNPQFNMDTLPTALQSVGLTYTHMAGLGGLRHTRPDSPNDGDPLRQAHAQAVGRCEGKTYQVSAGGWFRTESDR